MPGKRYPRNWMRLDREYLNQDTIRELGEQFGATGPLVFLAIILEAGKSASAGFVEMRFSALKRLAFTDAATAQQIVITAADPDLGLLDQLEVTERGFRAHLTRFQAWEAKDPTSVQRSANYRDRNATA